MNKRIVMIAGPYHPVPPFKGAAVEMWMYEVSKRFLEYEPHIICLGSEFLPDREFRDNIYFHRIRFGRLYKRIFQKITKIDPFSYTDRVVKLIKEIEPSIVHIHNTFKYALPIIEKLHRSKKNIKIILHMHNITEFDRHIRVDGFAGCSDFIITHYKQQTFIETSVYKVLYNGVDIKKFLPYFRNKITREHIRSLLGIEDKIVVLFVGRISPEKGADKIVECARKLKRDSNIMFVLVGEIPQGIPWNERAVYAKKLLDIKEKEKLSNVIFTDLIPPSKIHNFYTIGDILVVPSSFEEPFGMVAIEGMATALPVIAIEKGGLKEFIEHGKNGFLIPDDKNFIDNLIFHIKRVSSYETERRKIGENARKYVEKRFSWEKISISVEKFYQELSG